MYYQTQNFVYNRTFMDNLLKAFSTIPAAKLIATPTLCLLTGSPPNITPDTLLSDLAAAKANFSGYVDGTPPLTVPVRLSSGAEAAIGSSTFVATTASPFVSNVIVGYYLTDGTNLVGGELFPSGTVLPIAFAGDFVEIDLVLPGACYQAAS